MKVIDVKELAKKLCSTPGTVYAWKSMGVIPKWGIIKRGRRVLFDEEAVDKWLESMRQSPLLNAI